MIVAVFIVGFFLGALSMAIAIGMEEPPEAPKTAMKSTPGGTKNNDEILEEK